MAATLTHTLADRPLLCDLVSEMSSVVERLPRLDIAQGRETTAAALIIAAGLWPLANPAPHVTAMLSDSPELTRAHVDFEARLRQLLTTPITGFLGA